MIRRFIIGPDHEARAAEGVVPAVSLDALTQGLAEAAVLLYRQGGHLQVAQERTPGVLEGEHLTTAVVVEWKHHTDAKLGPEEPVAVTPAPMLMDLGTVAPREEAPDEDEPFLDARPERDEEEEADESSIPASLRG